MKDRDARLPLPDDDEYAFTDLFTYLVFYTAARFDPYFRLGYRSFAKSFTFRERESVASQILLDLLNSYNEFNRDGSGIRRILSAVDVKMLMLDLDNLMARTDEGSAEYVEDFKQYVGYLAERDLGILSGLDLLPERFMHVDSELPDMHDLKIESLCYQD